ncbi:hypothetical protein [Gluconobacter oxydans]|uniref:hypothetical protein n=1 Tax=Gluconobacter oxydans TaxID=442 RepID=UPI0039ECD6E2
MPPRLTLNTSFYDEVKCPILAQCLENVSKKLVSDEAEIPYANLRYASDPDGKLDFDEKALAAMFEAYVFPVEIPVYITDYNNSPFSNQTAHTARSAADALKCVPIGRAVSDFMLDWNDTKNCPQDGIGLCFHITTRSGPAQSCEPRRAKKPATKTLGP